MKRRPASASSSSPSPPPLQPPKCHRYRSTSAVSSICSSSLILLLIASSYPGVNAQDGSSELLPEKSASVLSSRQRIRCTDDSLRLYPNATSCPDERDPESCRMIFTTTASSNPATRDPKCDNPLLKDLAEQCRRTCAICCEDPSYACQNDESGIVNCNQNTEKCGMSEFSAMMIKFCPATCGLCLTKKCRDQIEDCEDMKSLCTNEIYATFMEHQCAKTCGKCRSEDDEDGSEEEDIDQPPVEGKAGVGGVGAGGKGSVEESAEAGDGGSREQVRGRPKSKMAANETCLDLWKNCKRNKKFCHHPSYKDMMRKNCARTCGFCKPQSGGGSGTSERVHSGSGGGGGGNGSGGAGSKERKREKKDCRDGHPFCRGWAKNGYCESDEYSEEEKREKCAKTCGLC